MTNLNNNIKAILSIIVLIFVFAYFFFCGWTAVKPDPQVTIAAVTSLGVVLGYWFGSSSGSSAKDVTIAAAVNTIAAPPVAPTSPEATQPAA